MNVSLAYSDFTTKGVRNNNQDNYFIESVEIQNSDLIAVLALADGMGGMAGGHIASELATKVVKEELVLYEKNLMPLTISNCSEFIKKIYFKANDRILDEVDKNPELEGMGTTLTCAFIFSNFEFLIANVGDSRAYLIYNDEIIQLTIDHNVITDSKLKNLNSYNDVNQKLYANALTRSMGADDFEQADIFGPFKMIGEETLLLSSDGFHQFINENEILNVLRNNNDFNSLSRNLVETASSNGSDDNITVICAKNKDLVKNKKKSVSLKTAIVLFPLLASTIYMSFLFYQEYNSFINHEDVTLFELEANKSSEKTHSLDNLIKIDTISSTAINNNHKYSSEVNYDTSDVLNKLEYLSFPKVRIDIINNTVFLQEGIDSLIAGKPVAIIKSNEIDSTFFLDNKKFLATNSLIEEVAENNAKPENKCKIIRSYSKFESKNKTISLNILFVEETCNMLIDAELMIICDNQFFAELIKIIRLNKELPIFFTDGN